MARVLVLFIVTLFAVLGATGCYRSVRTSTGEGSSSPFHSRWDSSGATVTCMDVRNAQDDATTDEAFALAERVGLITAGSHEVSVSYLDSTRLLCAQDDRREASGGSRAVTVREGCELLLAPDGIRPELSDRVMSSDGARVDPRLQDLVLPIMQGRLYLALFMADAQRYCQDREMSAAVYSAGTGFAPGFMPSASYGSSLFAGGGLGVSMFGLGGGMGMGATSGGMAMTNIVLDARGMHPGIIAVVTITGAPVMGTGAAVPSPMTVNVTPLMGAYRVSVPDGLDYNVSVQCMLNGMTHATGNTTECFSNRFCAGGQVDLDVICGRNF